MLETTTADGRGFERLIPADVPRARELAGAAGISTTLAQLLLHRGIEDAAGAGSFLEPSLAELTSPASMCDRDAAAERIVAAIRSRETIVVFGDYDVDGTTSATILADVIEMLGGVAVPLLANRFAGGYGLSNDALERCLERRPGLLVTCDCGSSDHERIAEANRRGVDVVVIDHHLVPDERLPALAFLNPHRPECDFPYKGMASAGLAFSVAAAVRAKLSPKLDMRPFLDLVAVGTIADVAPLTGDNRKLVRAGLARISGGLGRPGIAALLEVAGGRAAPLGARDVAFKLAPRINAAGRLGDPTIALELLRAKNALDARARATVIEQTNQARRVLQDRVTAGAVDQVASYAGEAPGHPVVAACESFHRGVVGISAAKLTERFFAPACVIAVEGGVGHGSVRSFGGADVHAMLEAVSPMLLGFGGHAAAAGFSIDEARILDLREALIEVVLRVDSARSRHKPIDLELGDAFAIPRASELARLEPVGEGNPSPRVLVRAKVERIRAVGEGRHHKLDLDAYGTRLSGFAPAGVDVAAARDGQAALIGLLRPDGWRGGEAVELEIESVQRDG